MTADNAELEDCARVLLDDLAEAGSRFLPGEVFYGQHADFAKRAWSLGTYLNATLDLARDAYYPQAFVVLRSALEHHVVDHLLFLGNRHRRLVKDVSDETFEEWQLLLASGEAAPDVVSIKRAPNGKDVTIVKSGMYFEGQGRSRRSLALSLLHRDGVVRSVHGQSPSGPGAHRRMALPRARSHPTGRSPAPPLGRGPDVGRAP